MKKALAAALLLAPLGAWAHGGHSIFDPNTLMHYFGSWEHALPIAAVAAFTVYILYRKSVSRRERQEG